MLPQSGVLGTQTGFWLTVSQNMLVGQPLGAARGGLYLMPCSKLAGQQVLLTPVPQVLSMAVHLLDFVMSAQWQCSSGQMETCQGEPINERTATTADRTEDHAQGLRLWHNASAACNSSQLESNYKSAVTGSGFRNTNVIQCAASLPRKHAALASCV
jgi:hypothetical protein